MSQSTVLKTKQQKKIKMKKATTQVHLALNLIKTVKRLMNFKVI
jgi:hypothetical protein